jgi:hypothetical protein
MSQNEEDLTAYMRVYGSCIGQDAIDGNCVYVGLPVRKWIPQTMQKSRISYNAPIVGRCRAISTYTMSLAPQ